MIKQRERKRLDPVKTRESILGAALKVFAEKGFAGASIAEIAAAAQVPKSLLQYHFGSKEELWKTCLDHKAVPILQPLDQFLEDESSANLTTLVAARFRVLQTHPQVARMLAWVSLGPAPLPEFIVQRQARMLRMSLSHSSVDFTKLLVALTAMDGWFLYRNLYRQVLGDRVAEDALAEKFLQSLTDIFSAPRPAEADPNSVHTDPIQENNR